MVIRPISSHRFALLLALTVGVSTLLLPTAVCAETPLNRGVVQSLRNSVRLLLQNQSPRPARVRDALTPGDALATARASLAELRFNDGSLARIGEQALFQFLPNTRTFRLRNGTVLLLIPPGRGRSRVQTPNAVAGIRGSALFVRYVPETDTTIVGALTQSGIEVSSRGSPQNQPLEAGQMAVIVKNRIERIYNFDLRTFYETSDIVKGLNLSGKESVKPADADIGAVQTESIEALNNQPPIVESQSTSNLDFLRKPTAANSSPSTPANSSTTQNLSERLEPFPLSPIDNIWGPPAVAQPTTVPPTVAIPIPPGQTGTTPGTVTIPGPRGNGLPGLPGIVPGVTGNAPGQGGSNPAGASGVTPPGLGNTYNPVRGNTGPPGQTGTAPGLAGTNPGRGGAGPPGQTGTAPGLAGTNPGRGGR